MRSVILLVARLSPMASLDLWFLVNQSRLRQEREKLEALSSQSEWLTLGAWRLDSYIIALDFDIDIGHRVYEATLRFPQTYPHSPAVVRPRDETSRWSAHQFGVGGDLCLHIRPDNWSPDLMGWQLIESAYQLLSGENPASGVRAEVPSAHRVTEGQRLRVESSRLSLTQSVKDQISLLKVGQGVSGRTVMSFQTHAVVRSITELRWPEQKVWVDSELPASLKLELYEGNVFVRRLAEGEAPPRISSYEEFVLDASQLGWTTKSDLLVVLKGDSIHAYSSFNTSVNSVVAIQPSVAQRRLSEEASALVGKRVGIVGCGSLGSKVATMLARTGVGAFVLIDDDVFRSENLVRNDLDWRDVGHHKVAALSHRLQRVQAGVDVSTHFRQLGGQESGTSEATVLLRLANCDLIVDATANPAVANTLSGFMQASNIPVVWAEVYGGGIGGLIGRCRPGNEPALPLMRRAIESWFADRGLSVVAPRPDYEVEIEGKPLVADDADVTTIAAHAARFSIDVLARPEASHYPWSIYVIGLAPCGLFNEPFEVHPIALPDPPPDVPLRELTPEELADNVSFIQGIIAQASGKS